MTLTENKDLLGTLTNEFDSVRVDTKEFSPVAPSRFRELRSVTRDMVISKSLKEFLGMELSQIKEVERVYASRDGDVMHVYTVVDEFNAEVRKNIYDREAAIIDQFEYLEFDFNIISRRGRDLAEVIAGSEFEFSYERP